MIFVTVGTQLPFDRLIKVIDFWAKDSNSNVYAQTGPTDTIYTNIECVKYLQQSHFEKYFTDAEVIIAHAGMGSILNALTCGKPIILMPRLASLGEHRNDHQVATAQRFENVDGIFVAWDEEQLLDYLRKIIDQNLTVKTSKISEYASSDILDKLKNIISK
ncbi:MAG: glycosyltransferase [Candidatus Thiodiazotropha sp. 6PLUC2]